MPDEATKWWHDEKAPYLCARCGDPSYSPAHPCCIQHGVLPGETCPACEASKAINRKFTREHA